MSSALKGTLCFGSVHRGGCDDVTYQRDRLARLASFALELVDAYRRRLAARERVGREVWDAKEYLAQRLARIDGSIGWLEKQRANWEQRAKALEQSAAELEAGKAWLEDQRQRYEATLREQQGLIRELQSWARGLESELHQIHGGVDVFQRQRAYRVLTRLGLLKPLSEPATANVNQEAGSGGPSVDD